MSSIVLKENMTEEELKIFRLVVALKELQDATEEMKGE